MSNNLIDYLNLSSGLEWARSVSDYRLVRLQSSQCESVKFWSIVLELDYQFLIDAATKGVLFHDCGSRSGDVSRAQWQGLEWIKWAYAKANGLVLPEVKVRQTNPNSFFEEFYQFGETDKFRKRAKQKLRYVYRLTKADELNIRTKSMPSKYDGDMETLATIGGFRNADSDNH